MRLSLWDCPSTPNPQPERDSSRRAHSSETGPGHPRSCLIPKRQCRNNDSSMPINNHRPRGRDATNEPFACMQPAGYLRGWRTGSSHPPPRQAVHSRPPAPVGTRGSFILRPVAVPWPCCACDCCGGAWCRLPPWYTALLRHVLQRLCTDPLLARAHGRLGSTAPSAMGPRSAGATMSAIAAGPQRGGTKEGGRWPDQAVV